MMIHGTILQEQALQGKICQNGDMWRRPREADLSKLICTKANDAIHSHNNWAMQNFSFGRSDSSLSLALR